MRGYSREEEAALPEFKSHEDARAYFKEKHGTHFMMDDSINLGDEGKVYIYYLLLNPEVFHDNMKELHRTGYTNGIDLIDSYQQIEIFEDGRVHMIH